MRAYCDLCCGAVSVAIVIVAVLNVALDPLDVLAAAVVRCSLLFHFESSFLNGILPNETASHRRRFVMIERFLFHIR